MNYKLISTDLDGTFLNSSEQISEKDNAAMKKLTEKGVIIVANTGRTLYEMPPCVYENPYIDYYIGSNGSVIYNKERKIVYNEYISTDNFAKVFALLKSYDTAFAIHEKGVSVLDVNMSTEQYWKGHRASAYAARNFIRFSDIEQNFDNRYSMPTEAEMICCYFKYANELDECTKRLSEIDGIATAASSGENIEVFNSKVNKGNTLLKLCDLLGIDKNETIAVGDSKNDINMLGVAGLSLAVSNAKEEVKAVADDIICSCDDGIMEYILNRYCD